MRKRTTAEQQLDLCWMPRLRWEDLPASQRAQVRELLGALLRAVAAQEIDATGGGGDDGRA